MPWWDVELRGKGRPDSSSGFKHLVCEEHQEFMPTCIHSVSMETSKQGRGGGASDVMILVGSHQHINI